MSNDEKYQMCFVEMFEVENKVAVTLEYQSITAWDSVGHMNLMGVIEEQFEIEMDIDDITEFSSYVKGKEILKKYGVVFND